MGTSSLKTRKPKTLKRKATPELDTQKLVSYTLDSLEGGVITISREGIVTSYNSVAERILEFPAADAVGEHYSHILPSTGDCQKVSEMVSAGLLEGATFSSQEAVMCTNSRKRIPVGATVSQLRDENGNSLGVVLIFKNLAEIKHIRDQILRTEQMAALGYLAAGLAHELRNPLGSLHGLAELMQYDLPDDAPQKTYTDTFIREIERMNKLVEDLLCFAQPPISTLERKNLNDVVRESLLFASYDFQDSDIEVHTLYESNLPEVMVDAERFGRALLNVIRNAFQATPAGGLITVSTSSMLTRKNMWACVNITNTGSYIPPEIREKLFTPFYTLKKNGTGLGLSIAHQIVKGHSGMIEVDSDPEDGTIFKILLPTADFLTNSGEERTNGNSHAG